MYFKITNEEENHNGFQYADGLNILEEKFNDDPDRFCCEGGFYFTDSVNIFNFLSYGIYLREVTLPTNNPDFKMVKDKFGDKWRANMIILGKRYDLFNVDTIKFLIEKGADIYTNIISLYHWSAKNGYLDIIKFLIEYDTIGCNYAFIISAKKGARLIYATLLHILIRSCVKVYNVVVYFS